MGRIVREAPQRAVALLVEDATPHVSYSNHHEGAARYQEWELTDQVGFVIGCEYDRTPFQFATCTNNVGWNTYKGRQ
ncbi:hypothetical protein BH11MYX4_BH11MYX4_44570 [soil metagenome]